MREPTPDLDDVFDGYIRAVFDAPPKNLAQLKEMKRSFFAGAHFVACNASRATDFQRQTFAFGKLTEEDKD